MISFYKLAVSVCNLEFQKTGKSANIIIKPVQLLAHAGLLGFSCPYITAKSALRKPVYLENIRQKV